MASIRSNRSPSMAMVSCEARAGPARASGNRPAIRTRAMLRVNDIRLMRHPLPTILATLNRPEGRQLAGGPAPLLPRSGAGPFAVALPALLQEQHAPRDLRLAAHHCAHEVHPVPDTRSLIVPPVPRDRVPPRLDTIRD